jgi:hypothetical protein
MGANDSVSLDILRCSPLNPNFYEYWATMVQDPGGKDRGGWRGELPAIIVLYLSPRSMLRTLLRTGLYSNG